MKTAAVIVALLTVVGAGCAGPPLGGGTGGRGAGGSTGLGGDGPCNTYYGYGCKTGQGGSLGSGGMIADAGNGVICEQLAEKYSAVLGAAAACTPGASGQCQVLVGNFPTNCPGSLCGQQSYVNDSYSAELEAARQSWLDEGCGGPPSTCITIGCDGPAPSVCVPTAPGAMTGTCVPYGSDAGASNAPDGGESCDQLVADYTAAVSAARACKPNAPNQCQVLLNGLPTTCNMTCGATVAANDATAVNDAWNRWANQCSLDLGCTLNICQPPPGPVGTCVVVDGGGNATGGICVSETPQTP